jgi:hypothetical protein
MKKKIFAVLAGAALIATGCVKTVSDTNTFALSYNRDSVSGRYNRSFEEVYQAAYNVVKTDGALYQEYVPHEYTNSVRSVEGRINDHKVWIRVEQVDPKVSQVDVEARTKAGLTDIDLAHQVEKEIALELAAH